MELALQLTDENAFLRLFNFAAIDPEDDEDDDLVDDDDLGLEEDEDLESDLLPSLDADIADPDFDDEDEVDDLDDNF